MNDAVFLHPDRKKIRVRPLKAWRHFRNLIADKEDTEQVFHIIESLNGKALLRDLKRFAKTPKGAARIAERQYLPTLLDDHKALRKLPDGSVGRAYLEFMEREGLSAQGLVDEFAKFREHSPKYDDMVEWYGNRLRDTHDLMHILTGYGRDALGEACVLGFSYSQNRGPGVIFISFMAGREISKVAPRGAPVMKAVREGRRMGKNAQKLAAQDIPALLAEPLEAARARMGFKTPTTYHRVHEVFKAAGVDPCQALAA